ncbi:fatty acyl-CoA reductase wat-like isoform X1 [Macrosteles quadrilineatus]|uniref:fatty acyl-CoA reductase wat-like isoform X1 n=1 Tax=Macrosteles quadrilineatus TaxID=74068 RepID=UPI0023E33945|nr:fatty acyl-CoA reductase wat-like isoform X1 [Macrosteles quadrilineatus]
MPSEESFDLSELLGDSLSLQNNIAAPARYSHTPKLDDYYDKFVLRDPYEILGERDFQKCERVESAVGTPIQEFYRGANVLITGATGFVGKILTEKLIRCVPNIGHIYLLIRGKKGKSSEERFESLLEDMVFRRMKAEVPDYASRLTAVEGDIGTPNLGLSPEDHHLLCDVVNIVFHSAADVRFIEPLKAAVSSNVLGSRRVLELAKEMKNLWAYVHVSTAYSTCVRRVVEEKVPTMNVYYKEMLKYIESKSDEELKEETPRLLQGWPNTYAYSKALCEEMMEEEAKDLPACIFRPSIIVSTYLEPVRGYTDNLYGPVGLMVGGAHGVIHCSNLNGDLTIDIIPVDYVVNCMIAAAWKTADEKDESTNSMKVYNCAATAVNAGIKWKAVIDFYWKYIDVWPFDRSIWYTSAFYTENYYIYIFFWYLLHRIPGYCFDKLAELTGNTPGLTKIYKKVQALKEQTDYFSLQEWVFKNDNVMEMLSKLSEEDKKIFYFDVRDIDFKECLLVSKMGCKYYYLKEKIEDIPAAIRKNAWLYWLHNSVKLTCSVIVLKLMVITARAIPF